MKSVRIGFSSSWDVMNRAGKKNHFFLQFLGKYDVNIVPPDEADYLFFTCFDGRHHGEAKPDTVKILFTGENFCPDFNCCDYALSFEYLAYGDRHFRMPLYLAYPDVRSLESRPPLSAAEFGSRPHFCNFIYSNAKAEAERDLFFQELNAHLPVHSAGKHLQNTKGLEDIDKTANSNDDKRRYMRDFRFSLAFENSTHPGYVTEKIVDAFIARTIPIYWGDPRVADEFNPASFIDVASFASRSAAIDAIVKLNQKPDLMLEMLNAAPLKRPDQIDNYMRGAKAFFEAIFDQDLHRARRRPRAGFAAALEQRRRKDEFGLRKHYRKNRV
jgi:alpha(1,3/1,4) fucosyltransferase